MELRHDDLYYRIVNIKDHKITMYQFCRLTQFDDAESLEWRHYDALDDKCSIWTKIWNFTVREAGLYRVGWGMVVGRKSMAGCFARRYRFWKTFSESLLAAITAKHHLFHILSPLIINTFWWTMDAFIVHCVTTVTSVVDGLLRFSTSRCILFGFNC